ncbi:MAG: hypothetical protein ACN4G0_16395, partial [Polyangiales bacterium]
ASSTRRTTTACGGNSRTGFWRCATRASMGLPGRAWVHLPITMGYDRYPEQLIDEKTDLLSRLVEQRARLFFTHDHEVALGRVARNEKGRFSTEETWADLVGAPL